MDGAWQTLQGDFSPSLKRQNFLVTETNAQTLGWDSSSQYPPYDGQLRLDVYTDVSSGANMVEYRHWHSIHAGQETYWKGVLSHDLEPNRAYAEVTRIAHELRKIGPGIVNLKINNDVAILYSVDSSNALSFMPMVPRTGEAWVPGKAAVADFVSHAQAADSPDELSIFITRQLMQRHAPSLMMLTLHDMDIAHSGAYSLYVDAIRRADRLCAVADDSGESRV
jgi:beta-galactosidase GanA